MTPELWARLNPLFHLAVEKSPAERDAFVAEACGDDLELHRELVALVKAHEQKGATTDKLAVNFQNLIAKVQAGSSPSDIVPGRFKIVRQLGSGGMGDVYEALDLELAQTVALKLIRPDIAGDDGVVSRFKKEVQLARRLGGPNLCRIHELFVIPGDGVKPAGAFLTMEYLDGVTLADKVQQSGPIPWRDAQAIVPDICAGLSTMHEAGIIHRDLKSRNIMLADRGGSKRAVLMDFGLAHEVSVSPSTAETTLTAPGTFIGTPEYMAPEQFEGKEVSPATDIYAMGVVLYEMLTGKHPFAAPNVLRAAVLRSRRPDPPSSIQKGLPQKWDMAISRCLEYDPRRRYQSAAELAGALRGTTIRWETLKRGWLKALTLAAGPVLILISLMFLPAVRERLQGIFLSSHEKHIALLPFDIAGNDQENVALGDGLMDSLSGKLASLEPSNASLWVVPAIEVRRRKVNDPPAALREFGATIVIQGSFERRNQATRLRMTLIDPRKTREIGFVDVASDTGDLAALQDEAIIRLGRLMNTSFKDKPARDEGDQAPRAAYEDYLAGLGYFQRSDKPGNLELAIASLQRALKTDPSFALAYARLAQVCTTKYLMSSDTQWLRQAENYGKRAAEIDDRVPTTYVALGQIHELTGNHGLAIHEFQRAIDLDPTDSEAISGIANSFKNAGRNTEAEAAYIRAAALRPTDWKGYNDLGIFYEQIGRPSEAIAQFKRSLELTPDNAWPYSNLGMAYMDFDDPKMLDEAERALKKSIALSPTFAAYLNLGFLYAQEHRFAESVSANREAIKLNDQDYNAWDNLTAAYEWLKDDRNADAARREAIGLLQTIVKQNPQDAVAQATLSALLAKSGSRNMAVDKIHIALAFSPDNAYVLSQVSDAYELLGERMKAIQTLQKALKRGLSKSSLSEDPEIQDLIRDPRFKLPGI